MRRCGAQKGVALLAIVGTIVGSHGSSSPARFQLRVRSSTSSMHISSSDRECNVSQSALESASPIISSTPATAVSALCARGGSVDDDPRRRRGDRPPPRRYDVEDRDRPRPSSSGPRPSRGDPRSRGEDRDRRYNDRHDMDDFDGRSGRSREVRGDRRGSYDDRDRRGRDPGRDRQLNNVDTDSDDGKSKKWFTLSKKDKKEKQSSEIIEQTEPAPWSNDPSTLPPPPPPPPPSDATISSPGVAINPAETERTPIHYMFPTAEAAAEERRMSDAQLDQPTIDGEPDIPFLDVEEDEFSGRGDESMGRRRRRRDDDFDSYRSSPRRDAVTMKMSTRRGALQVRFGGMIVGAALGGFIGKSLMNDPVMMSAVMSSLLFLTGFLRNDYGELSRALGLAFIMTLQRTRSVRKEYPTLPHLKAMIRQGPRKPFPPVEDGESPWRYEPIYRNDPEFKMTYALLTMALVGSFCGGNVPMLPAWMGGIIGAVAFASLTMGSNARGDLGRAMGMRVVGLVKVVLDIQSDLRILGKAATVGGLIFDKVMIMDRKHRIKDRIVAISKWGYEKVSRTADQVKEDMDDTPRPERDRPSRR